MGGSISMNSPSSVGHYRPPASRMVRFERECLVLRQDVDVAQVGVDAGWRE